MRKPTLLKAVALVCTAAFTVFSAFAQEGEAVNKGTGLIATLDMAVDTFNTSVKTFEHSDIRGPSAQNGTEIRYLISNWDFSKNARASIGYNGNKFGGSFAFVPLLGDENNWAFGARIKGWARFGDLRFTLGNDIETSYADAQGADPGLRIYTGGSWNSYANPDNITDSNGLMAEALIGNLNVAAAAGLFATKLVPTPRITNGAANDNIYEDRYDTSYRYGARVGYDLGETGRANVSYKISQRTVADSYYMKGRDSSEVVAQRADAKVFNHEFGVYGSFYLPGDLGLTVAYLGTADMYLKEYFNTALSKMVETGHPVVYKNGINLNARWTVNDRLSLRADNCLTFWQDKNYDLFSTNQSNWNKNLVYKEEADRFAPVDHFVLWNGLGAGYGFTDNFGGSVYVRNLLSRYSASGLTPGGNEHEYVFLRNQVLLSLGLSYSFNSRASVYVNLEFDDMITSRSRDLNFQSANYFVDKVHNHAPEAVPTLDNVFTVRVPVGITLILQ
jgi:hypothetical protein